MSAFEEQELKRLEDALSGLTPRPAQFDRDGLIFEAGRRSVRPNPLWFWSTVVMTSLAGLFGFLLVLHLRTPASAPVHFMDSKRPAPMAAPMHAVPPPMPTTPAEADDERDLPPSGSAVP
jgi:hypothetical protein